MKTATIITAHKNTHTHAQIHMHFHFETESCGIVIAPKSDVSPVQTSHKTQQLISSTIRRLVAHYSV
jgi:hypothetical protein